MSLIYFFPAFNYTIGVSFQNLRRFPKSREPLMCLKHPKINFHWRRKISVGWARCSWTWKKISTLSEIGVHWNSIYDLKGTVSMSVSPRANSYTSRLQRVGSKRPKGTRHQTVHICTSYSLTGTIFGVIWPYRYIKFCSLSCLHLGSGFESLLCRCLMSSLRMLGLLGTYEIKKKVVFTELKAVLEKLSAPCESVASAFQTSFITNNLKFCSTLSVSHIVVVDFWSTLLGKGTSVYWSFAGSHLLRSCHSISVGLNFDEFWLGHGNSLIFIFLVLCLGSLCCCMTRFWLLALGWIGWMTLKYFGI